MSYRVVYDISQEWPALWFPASGLIFVVLGALAWRHRDDPWMVAAWRMRTTSGLRAGWSGFFLGFAILWTVISAVGVIWTHLSAQQELRQGSVGVVEGVVEDFHPMPFSGHDTERFRVKDVHFAYSDFVIGAGFNNTSSHGGPIRAGLPVRIHYVGTRERATILKLEIGG